MPRASKMKPPVPLPKDGDHVFYWPDTGPVQCQVEAGGIVSAKMVIEPYFEWRAS
jgi:hypothetical protein